MIAAMIYARIPEPPREAYKRPCQTDQSRVEIKIFRDAGTDTAQHAVDSLRYNFLPFIKVSFSFIIRCFAGFVKLHLDPVYLEEQGRPRICSAQGRSAAAADGRVQVEREVEPIGLRFWYRSGCHTAPCRCRPSLSCTREVPFSVTDRRLCAPVYGTGSD